VLPAFEVLAPDRPPRLKEERYRAYRALRSLLSAIAAEAPVVLALDDVQWADPGSEELACHLLAHPPRGAVLVALGLRPAQISPQLTTALAAALREHRARRLDLPPLDAAAAHELLGCELPAPTRDRLVSESGGNPFFLLQLARAASLPEGGAAAGPGDSPSIPHAVRAALASELSSLSAPARVLLQGAAVAGDPFEDRVAATAADMGEEAAVDLIDELLAFQLVMPAGAPGRFGFRHPIVRATAYETSASGWRVRAHARVAGLLAARGASASARAPHVERSAREGDAEAVATLVAAAVASSRRAPALSARWFAAALALLPDDVPDSEHQRIELLIAMATALGASGQLERAKTALCQVLERLPVEAAMRAPVIAYCAGVEQLLGHHRRARARLSRAHDRLADPASADAVALKIELAVGCGYESRLAEMESWAESALHGATRLGDRTLEVVAAGVLAYARYSVGRPGAQRDVDRAGALLDAIDDAALATRLDGALWIAWAEGLLQRYDRAIEHCERAIDVSRATGHGAFLLDTMTAQAFALIWTGRLDGGRRMPHGGHRGRAAVSQRLPVAGRRAGEHDRHRQGRPGGSRASRGGMHAARKRGRSGASARVQRLLPRVPADGAGRRAARPRRRALHDGWPRAPVLSRPVRCLSYEILTRAELALGRVEAADAWARMAQAATHDWQYPGESAAAHRAMAFVAIARGDAAHAAQITLEAAAEAERIGAPIEAGRCRIVAARALAQANRRDDAIAALERAARELARAGGDGFAAEADKELRRMGRRVARRQGAGGLASLTERERTIADLVHRGHTNREIAATSYVSEKTVERHLTNIFTKLGVSSRGAVASIIAADAASAASEPRL
jgi:DNA-binding CsgD family transcriptional regulator/tetratricopeptide (TPR) repeat protein